MKEKNELKTIVFSSPFLLKTNIYPRINVYNISTIPVWFDTVLPGLGTEIGLCGPGLYGL